MGTQVGNNQSSLGKSGKEDSTGKMIFELSFKNGWVFLHRKDETEIGVE